MAAPEKYPDELGERPARTAVEARRDPATKAGAPARVAQQPALNSEVLWNWVRPAETARTYRYGHPGTVL